MTGSTKLKRTLALALAGGALAIGVPAALAAGGSDTPSTAPSNSTFIQDEGGQARPDRGPGGPGDCPEKDGNGPGDGSSQGSGSADTSGATEL